LFISTFPGHKGNNCSSLHSLVTKVTIALPSLVTKVTIALPSLVTKVTIALPSLVTKVTLAHLYISGHKGNSLKYMYC